MPRDLPIPRRELLGLLGQLPGLAPHDEEQLVARHLLRPGHRKIDRTPADQSLNDTPATGS